MFFSSPNSTQNLPTQFYVPPLLSQTKQKVKTKHRILLILAIHSWTWRPDLDYDQYTYPVTLH